jgi:DNA-binding GntR family transcriptional regulator
MRQGEWSFVETKKAHIDRVSVASQVYQYLREAILSGEMAQGSRVVEAQIARTLDISRAPVREAVNRLLQEGLLESKTHFGPSVIQMTPQAIRSLYDLRAAIEGLAIREVVRRRSELDLSPLRACIAEMTRRARDGDLAGVVDAELEFHRIIWRLANNPYLVTVGAMLDAQVRLALTIDNAHYEELSDVADEHLPILEAIESGEADTAAQLMATHILSSLQDLTVAPDGQRQGADA